MKDRIFSAGWRRALPFLVAVIVALVFAIPAADVPFYTKGEAREAVLVQAMVRSGDYVLPLRNGNEIPTKPPLFHWLAAASSRTAGSVSELGVRMPSILAAAIVAGVVVWFGQSMFSAAGGLVAAVVLCSSVTFFVSATAARVDMVLAAAVTLAIGSFALDCLGPRRGLGHAFHAAVAAAALAKGPVGAVLPWSIVLVFLLASKDREYLRRLNVPKAMLWLLVPSAWYVGAYASAGDAFLSKQLFQENFQRLVDAEGGGTGHVKPFYAHVPLLLGGFAPWSLTLLVAFAYAARESLTTRAKHLLLLLCWVLVPLTIFSLAGSKRAVYMLPSYPALALLVGWWWTVQQGWTSRAIARADAWWRFATLVTGMILLVAFGLIALETSGVPFHDVVAPWMSEGDQANLEAIIRQLDTLHAASMALAAVCVAAAGAFVSFAYRLRRVPVAVAATVLSVVAIVGGGLTFQRTIAHSQSVDEFVRTVRECEGDAGVWLFYRDVSYPVAFYAEKPVPRVDSLKDLAAFDRAVVFAHGENESALIDECALTGLRVHEIARFTYDGNPRRDPLVAWTLETQ